jgi:hypothetical protein
VLGVALALTLSAGGGELKLAAHELTLTGMDPGLAEGLTDHLAQSFQRVSVVSPRDIRALIGLERQKELMGCADAASNCMAELGNALGVSQVIVGEVLKVGPHVQVHLRVLTASSGKIVANHSEELRSTDDLLPALVRAAHDLEQQMLGPLPSTARASRRPLALIPLGVAVIAGAVGGVLLGLESDLYARLTVAGQPGSFAEDPLQAAARGRTFQTTGVVLVSAAVVCLLAAAAIWLFADAPEGGQ